MAAASAASVRFASGRGRGATGSASSSSFTGGGRGGGVRPGIVMARPQRASDGAVVGASATQPPPGYIPGVGRGAKGLGDTRNKGTYTKADIKRERDEAKQKAADAVAAATLFRHGGRGDRDDVEADAVYDAVDAHIDGRNTRKLSQDERPPKRPAVADMFADAKLKLATMTEADWDAIPDSVADISGGNRLLKAQDKASRLFGNTSDAMLLQARGPAMGAVDASDEPGTASVAGVSAGSGAMTDLGGVGQARNKMLDMQFTHMEDSVSGQTVVDPQGFMTSMQAKRATMNFDAGDIKRGRLLVRSLVKTNPLDPQSWIAAARFEATAQQAGEARKLIKEGCTRCPKSEEVWLEAAKLCRPDEARSVLAAAVRHVAKSVGIWLKAAELETGSNEKKAVLRKAVELIPTSVRLWREAIAMEEPEEAKILLAQAVRCVPKSVDLWLALARLETYDNARRVLKRANREMPSEPRFYVAAARLEEQNGNSARVPLIVKQAVSKLLKLAPSSASTSTSSSSSASAAAAAASSASGADGEQSEVALKLSDREGWLEHARQSETAGFTETAAAIIRFTLHIGVETPDEVRTWTADAKAFENAGHVTCARAALGRVLDSHKDRVGLWRLAAELERRHGDAAAIDSLLRRGVTHCPKAVELWLMAARQKLDLGDIEASRAVLTEAFAVNQGSEAVMLAAVKLERRAGVDEAARALLAKARSTTSTERVWMKSALLEMELRRDEAAERLLKDALKLFPASDKLWLMLCELTVAQGHLGKAQALFSGGVKYCPNSVPLRRQAARLEERCGGAAKARSLLEAARVAIPANELLYLDSVRLEERAGNPSVAAALLARALQECPASALLWAEHIQASPKVEHSGLAKRANTHTGGSGQMAITVGRLLWRSNKTAGARRWLQRAVQLSPALGDAWANLYRFEREHGSAESAAAVMKQCLNAQPRYGEHWAPIAKRLENRSAKPADVLVTAAMALPAVTESVRSHAIWPIDETAGVEVVASHQDSSRDSAGAGGDGDCTAAGGGASRAASTSVPASLSAAE